MSKTSEGAAKVEGDGKGRHLKRSICQVFGGGAATMRGPRRWCLTLLLGLGLVLCDETSSPLPRTELRIGCLKSQCTAAGAGGGSSTSGKSFNPTFEGFLNRMGATMKPVRTFQLKLYDDEPSIIFAMETGDIDMAFAPAAVMSCLQVAGTANPLLTLVETSRSSPGSPAYGDSLMITRASEGLISDARQLNSTALDLKVAVTCLANGPGFQFPSDALQKEGIYLTQAPYVLVFVGCDERNVVSGIYQGQADVGFIGSRVFNEMLAENEIKASDFKVVAVLGGQDAFPFAPGKLLPGWGISANPSLDEDVTRAVSTWLLSLNASSSEASRGNYLRWIVPTSYLTVMELQRSIGVIKESAAGDGSSCKVVGDTATSHELYTNLVCPPDMSPIVAPCPRSCPGLHCLCSPCSYTEPLVLTMELTGGVYVQRQKEPFDIVIADIAYRPDVQGADRNITWTLFANNLASGIADQGAFYRSASDPSLYSMKLTLAAIGEGFVNVYNDGVPTSFSPIPFRIVELKCNQPLTNADAMTGDCGCNPGYVQFSGSGCVANATLWASVAAAIAVLLLIGGIWRWRRSREKQRGLVDTWLLKSSELILNEPRVILGAGTFGPILLGRVRGTEVAVKRMWIKGKEQANLEELPPSPDHDKKSTRGGGAVKMLAKSTPIAGADSLCDVSVRDHNFTNIMRFEDTEQLFKTLTDPEVKQVLDIPLEGLATITGTLHMQIEEARVIEYVREMLVHRSYEGSVDIYGTSDITGRSRFKAPKLSSSGKISRCTSDGKPSPSDDSGPAGRRGSLDHISRNGRSRTSESSGFGVHVKTVCSESGPRVQRPGLLSKSRDLLSSFGGVSRMSSYDVTRTASASREGLQARDTTSFEISSLKYTAFIKEMRAMVQLRHPCIVSVIGGIVNRKDVPYLILEHMEQHSLQEILENQNVVLEGEMVMPILNDVVNGMRCLHELASPIVHGDLRAKNVLVDKNFRAKVHNFGFSNKAVCHIEGSAYWMSPERLRGERAEAPSDVYAYGMLLYEVFTRKEPFEGENMFSVLMEIAEEHQSSSRTMMKRGCKRPIPHLSVPAEMRKLMKMCWEEDPLGRPTFRQIHDRMGKASILGVANQALEKIRMSNQLAKGANKVLNQVFPQHVAEQLVAGNKVEPEHKDEVAIFFSDIVGYTSIASQLQPQQISNLLDRLYTMFDKLSVELDVFKVETIGDAYMAVSNLHKDQSEDYMRRMADFALKAVEAAQKTQIDQQDALSGHIQIRCGIHVGPVVAHVVGTRNPRYCLFGDTVNTASRMESLSLPGFVHISAAAARVLNQQTLCQMECRGKVDVKGKGKMVTWWIKSMSTPQFSSNKRRNSYSGPIASNVSTTCSDATACTSGQRWSSTSSEEAARHERRRRAQKNAKKGVLSEDNGLWSRKIDRLMSGLKERQQPRTLHPVRQAQGSADSEGISRSRSCDNPSFDTLGDDISLGSKDQEVEMTSPMANINRRLSKIQMAIEIQRSLSDPTKSLIPEAPHVTDPDSEQRPAGEEPEGNGAIPTARASVASLHLEQDVKVGDESPERQASTEIIHENKDVAEAEVALEIKPARETVIKLEPREIEPDLTVASSNDVVLSVGQDPAPE